MHEKANNATPTHGNAMGESALENSTGGLSLPGTRPDLIASSLGGEQRIASAGAANSHFAQMASQIHDIFMERRGLNRITPILERLHNDSSHIQQLRNFYWSNHRRNLVSDILNPPGGVRWGTTREDQALALLNMSRRQAVRYIAGEYSNIDDERSQIRNLQDLNDRDRNTIDSDQRSDAGLEYLMGTRADEITTPIRGNTTGTYYNINSSPSWNSENVVLGVMDGSDIPITVIDKAPFLNGDKNKAFYKVRFQDTRKWEELTGAQRQALQAKKNNGTISSKENYALELIQQRTAWIVDAGIEMAIPWSIFIRQLWAFDQAFGDKPLKERITTLRQMAHPSNLPFDEVIGARRGRRYSDTRPDMGGLFQLLKDSGKVQLPNGESLDIYHCIVGLDVLYRKIENHSITQMGLINVNVGQNYSSATWSGDIGAGATDAAVGYDEEWENRNTRGLSGDSLRRARTEHYYTTRAPESDLWGNIDAWGMEDAVNQSAPTTSVTQLLMDYYGRPAATYSNAEVGAFNGRRKNALKRFLQHYGARTRGRVAYEVFPVLHQQIGIFAETWDLNRRRLNGLRGDPPDLATYVHWMASRFAHWLNDQADRYNVTF